MNEKSIIYLALLIGGGYFAYKYFSRKNAESDGMQKNKPGEAVAIIVKRDKTKTENGTEYTWAGVVDANGTIIREDWFETEFIDSIIANWRSQGITVEER